MRGEGKDRKKRIRKYGHRVHVNFDYRLNLVEF